jgi:hypothetical protein
MKPNLSNIQLPEGKVKAIASSSKFWKSPEGIPVKVHFTQADLNDAEHLRFAAGLPPYLRVHIRLCMSNNLGLYVNMQGFQLPKNQMLLQT